MLAPWLLAPHLKAMFDAVWAVGMAPNEAGAKPARRWPLALGGAAATALVLLSPAAHWLYGKPLPQPRRVGPMEPQHLVNELLDRPAAARRVFTIPYWWGDYLLWRLPPEDRVYWYSRPEAWLHATGGATSALDPSPAEWRALVERYRFNTLLVRAESSAGLLAYLRETPPGEWEVIADNTAAGSPGGGPDSRGLVAVRRSDPFVLSLAQADAAAACVSGLGLAPSPGQWSVLSNLPWAWPAARDQKSEVRSQEPPP
jgi:hypothetical protein